MASIVIRLATLLVVLTASAGETPSRHADEPRASGGASAGPFDQEPSDPGTPADDPTAATPNNGASFVSQDIPPVVYAGSTFNVSVTMRNTGLTTWSLANMHFLGSQGPMDNMTWGTNRVWMDGAASVPPGGTYTFVGTVIAPDAAGTYTMQWQMLRDAVEWFGDMTPVLNLSVFPTVSGSASEFVSQSVPASVVAGATFDVSETFRNIGSTTWTTDFRLGSQGPMDNVLWGTNRIYLPPGTTVAPGQSYTFTFHLTAPASPAPYPMQWQLVHEGVEWFGARSPDAAVNVTPPPPVEYHVNLRTDGGFFVVAELGGGDAVNANRTAPGIWETFTLIDLDGAYLDDGDAVAFRTHDELHYLHGQGSNISAIATSIGFEETFTIYRAAGPGPIGIGKNIALRAPNGQYLTAEGGGGGTVTANSGQIGPWETFKLLREGGGNEPRPGRVRLDNRVATDDAGPFNALGTTLFWALSGYRNERERLEENLQFLSDSGLDYIRVLGNVGDDDPTSFWAGHTADPRWPDYDQMIAGLTDLAYDQYGLRIQWTIFGGSTFSPSPADRLANVDRFLAMSRGREQKIMMFEIANEGFQNGFGGAGGIAELRSLTRHMKENTDILVAASAYRPPELCDVYAGGVADIATVHFDRTNNFGDGVWRPIRQPWNWTEGCTDWPPATANNEPIGPSSSVASDADPLRMVMAPIISYIAGIPLHVFHTGSGVRGVDDPTHGRPPNMWQVENIATIVAGYQALRAYMPTGVQNWTRHNAQWASYPFYDDVSQFVRAYAATNGVEVVAAPIGMVNPVSLAPKAPMHLEAIEPLTGNVLAAWNLGAGEWVTLPTANALFLHGWYR